MSKPKLKRKRKSPIFYMLSGITIGLLSALSLVAVWVLFIGQQNDDLPILLTTPTPVPFVPPAPVYETAAGYDPIFYMTVSPDNERVAFTSGDDNGVYLYEQNIMGEPERDIITQVDSSSGIFYSRDGRYVAYHQNGKLMIQRRDQTEDIVHQAARGGALLFSPNSQYAIYPAEGYLHLLSLDTMTVTDRVAIPEFTASFAISPDSRVVAHNIYEDDNPRVALLEVNDGKFDRLDEVTFAPTVSIIDMVFHPTENVLFVADVANDHVYVIEEGYSVSDVAQFDSAYSLYRLSINDTGERLLVKMGDRVHQVPLAGITGISGDRNELQPAIHELAHMGFVEFVRDDTVLLASRAGGALQLWHIDSNTVETVFGTNYP